MVTKDVLEKLLVAAVLKALGMNRELDVISFNRTIELLTSQNSIMQKIPLRINQSIEELQNERSKSSKTKDKYISFYPQKGIILYDGIYGSAFGRMNYFYRSKGTRIFLFKDKSLDVVATYCTINEDGFNFSNESIDTNEVVNNIASCSSLLQYMDVTVENIPLQMIKFITHIKQPFTVDYYIEYLLLPPDVDKISNYSLKAQSLLWKICLSAKFRKEWGTEIVNTAISLLISIGLLPPSIELLNFIKKSAMVNVTDLMGTINHIAESIDKQNSSLLSSINLGMGPLGVGINPNVLWEKLKKVF